MTVSLRAVTLSYRVAGHQTLRVLDIPELDIPTGASLAISGPSGSGKTSLLHVLAGLETPQSGTVTIGGVEVSKLGESARDRWRRDAVGFVFQDFNLFPGLSPIGNVVLPVSFRRGRASGEERTRARQLLERVGLAGVHRPVETLSRGEMQRVAVARALLHKPPLVLADEPTASLDEASAAAVTDLLIGLCREEGATLVVVTHDDALGARLTDSRRLVAGHMEAGHA